MTKYLLHDVFTPTKPARVAFVERSSINDKLVNALRTPGKQLVVYGPSGSGKTTLLVNKLHQLYENHITTRCMKGLTFEQLVLDAFDQLAPFYTSERIHTIATSIDAQLRADYLGIKSQLGASSEQQMQTRDIRVLPQQLTPQALGRFLGATKCCWLVEDFHKIDDSQKTQLAQLMKVFMDLADEYRDLKIIAIGAVDTARQVVEYDKEMRNRVAEILVPLMESGEIETIIAKGEVALNIQIDPQIKRSIAHYSNGLASVCHHICLNMCTSGGIFETLEHTKALSTHELDSALTLYIDEASDTLKAAFDKAFKQKKKSKFDNAKLIIEALLSANEHGATRPVILEKIARKFPEFPPGNFNYFVSRLQTEEYGAILRYDPASGLFSFSDPIYRVFALVYFRKRAPTGSTQDAALTNLSTLLLSLVKKHQESSGAFDDWFWSGDWNAGND